MAIQVIFQFKKNQFDFCVLVKPGSHGQLKSCFSGKSRLFYPFLSEHSQCTLLIADTDWASGGYPICGGENQSPINIDSDQAVQEDYSGFQMSLGYKLVQKGHLENDGHTCE